MAVEAAPCAEMEEHLGYGKHEARGRGSGNSRNGLSRKTLKGDHGAVEIETPRDRNQVVVKSTYQGSGTEETARDRGTASDHPG